MPNWPVTNIFTLSAFDRDQWCPVLQTSFRVDDLEALRPILGEQAKDDLELRNQYLLDDDELSAVITRFAVLFDPANLPFERLDISLIRRLRISAAPYLIHTGYELPLLLDGRKKLARMSHEYPPRPLKEKTVLTIGSLMACYLKSKFLSPSTSRSRDGWGTGQYTIRPWDKSGAYPPCNCYPKLPGSPGGGTSILSGSRECFSAIATQKMIGGSMSDCMVAVLAELVFAVQSASRAWHG
jgi:hypothetical protein